MDRYEYGFITKVLTAAGTLAGAEEEEITDQFPAALNNTLEEALHDAREEFGAEAELIGHAFERLGAFVAMSFLFRLAK